ncbi:MAG: hypothetical protein A2014_04990 [Spirochaetes bacterium GWF1_49_6]|nr:MAG: hypothetical protein A2014_04990 [Spirochaetes bacterium GWF1_49_6]
MKKAILFIFGALFLSSCAFLLPPSISEDYIYWRDIGSKQYQYSLFSNYNIIADIQGDSLIKFGVAEDTEYFYFYYQFGNYRGGNYLTTIGKLNHPNGGIAGKYMTSMDYPSRDYGTASNSVEMIFPLNYYNDSMNLLQNMNGQTLYLYVQDYANIVYLVDSGMIDQSVGYLVCDDKNMEIMLKKSVLGLTNIALKDLAFAVGRWGSGNMDGWGVDNENFCPNRNLQDVIRYYVKTDKSVVYRGGPAQGYTFWYNNTGGDSILYSSFSGLLQSTVGMGFFDIDNNSTTGTMVVRINTNGVGANSSMFYNLTNYTSQVPQDYQQGYYKKDYGFVTNISQLADGKLLALPGKRMQVYIVYSDASTWMTVSNSFYIEKSVSLALDVSGIMSGSYYYTGRVAFPNTYNNYDSGGWQFDLQNGYFYGSIQIGESQIPNGNSGSGFLILPYSSMYLDGFTNAPMFPDCTAFDYTVQGIKVTYDGINGYITIFDK